MIEFGKTLREAREAKGLTVGQVAETTHLMTQAVENLENEDFRKIVAPIYGRGFVKLYCEAVGLDPKPMVDAFMDLYNGNRQPAAETPAAPPPPPPPPPPAEEPALASEPPQQPFPSPRQATFQDPEPRLAGAANPPRTEPPAEKPTAPSRYAAPMPIDDPPGDVFRFFNWRLIVLLLATALVVFLAVLGIRALYRATMTDSEPAANAAENRPAAAPAPRPATTDADVPSTPRKPLPIKPLYLDSDHSTEGK